MDRSRGLDGLNAGESAGWHAAKPRLVELAGVEIELTMLFVARRKG